MSGLMLAYHVLHDLTVSDLLDSAILAGVDVEPVQMLSVRTSGIVSATNRDKHIPVGLVVHGRHIAFLDHTVFLGEVGLGECLF